MPERSPISRLSELKEQLRGAQEIQLDDAPRFSLENAPDKEIKPITISPKEQIRYKENDAFAEAVYSDLHWLLDQTGTISVEEFEQKSKATEAQLTAAQLETFTRIRDSLKSAIESAAHIDQKTINEVIQKARELNYLLPDAQPTVEVIPWGAIVLHVKEEEFRSPFDQKSLHKQAYKITEVSRQGINDPTLAALLEQTIVLKKTNNEERNAKVKRHELFHAIYAIAIAPEQPVHYDDDVEKRMFAQIKDEVLAYLFEGRWQPDLRDLCLDVRLKGPDKDMPDNFMDLWGFVVRSLQKGTQKSMATPEINWYENEADDFIDHVWLLTREIARLYYLRASVEEGIKAVLTSQDAKEAMYKLRRIGDRERLDGETLWQVIRHEQKEDAYEADELYAEHVKKFLGMFDFYQLPLVKNHEKFFSALEEYIHTLKSQEVPSDEDRKMGREIRVRALEEALANLRERETPPPVPSK